MAHTMADTTTNQNISSVQSADSISPVLLKLDEILDLLSGFRDDRNNDRRAPSSSSNNKIPDELKAYEKAISRIYKKQIKNILAGIDIDKKSKKALSDAVTKLLVGSVKNLSTNRGVTDAYAAGIAKQLSPKELANARLKTVGVNALFGQAGLTSARSVVGLTRTAFAAYGGAAAAGGAVGGALGAVGTVTLIAAIDQLGKTLKENTKAMLGGSYAASRRASGAFGYFSMYKNPAMTVGDYNAYRTHMRKMGLRDENAIEEHLVGMAKLGIFGSHGKNAVTAALSQETLKRRMGLDIDNAFLQQMNIATGGSQSSALKQHGSLSVTGLGVMIGRANVLAQNKYGASLGTDQMFNLVKQMTTGLLGMNNNIGDVVGALAAFSKKLTEGKLTTEEFTAMWKGVNEGMSQQNMMNLVALAGRNAGRGNVLENMYTYIKNTRDASGKVSNWRLAATTALQKYREWYGSDTAENRMKAMLDGGLLDQLGFGGLKKNPEWVSVLQGAAAGSSDMAKKLEDAAKSDSDELARQTETLDAIRNPIEHMRDWLFGIKSLNSFSWKRSRENQFDLMMQKAGIGQNKEAYRLFKEAEEKKAEADKVNYGQALAQNFSEFWKGPTDEIVRLLEGIYNNNKSNGESYQDTSGVKKVGR